MPSIHRFRSNRFAKLWTGWLWTHGFERENIGGRARAYAPLHSLVIYHRDIAHKLPSSTATTNRIWHSKANKRNKYTIEPKRTEEDEKRKENTHKKPSTISLSHIVEFNSFLHSIRFICGFTQNLCHTNLEGNGRAKVELPKKTDNEGEGEGKKIHTNMCEKYVNYFDFKMKWMMSVDVDPKICAHNSISTECDSIWWVWWFGISLVASRVWWFSCYSYSYSITNNTKLRMMIFFRLPISNWRFLHSAHTHTLWSGPRNFCLNNRDILSYIDRHKLCSEQNAYIISKSVEISMVRSYGTYEYWPSAWNVVPQLWFAPHGNTELMAERFMHSHFDPLEKWINDNGI